MRKQTSILVVLVTSMLLSLPLAGIAQEQPKRENIEWLDVWMPETNSKGLPRVLLIGNSITRQYFKEVELQLNGKAFVARLSTSKSFGDPGLLREVALVMKYEKFDVVHFNNGMHGWGYTEEEYSNAFPEFLQTIRRYAPDAKLIWANTTPVRDAKDMKVFDDRNSRVIERNRRINNYLKNTDIKVNDLYSLMVNNIAFYGEKDGVHPAPLGVKALATQVSDEIKKCLGYAPGLDEFPLGYTPREVGTKLARHFIPSKHFLHGGKWIHYAEVCSWLGALRYARTSGDKELIEDLQKRFDLLFTTEKSYLPIMNHVDLNMFGCLPLEFYQITGEQKYYELGIPYADTQWKLPPDAKPEEKTYAKMRYSWQTRLWIDDMFMITIVQSQAYYASGKKKYIDRAAREMIYYLDKLQLPNGLFYHAPDVPFIWARGNGWMAAGMAELLKALPEKSSYRSRIMEGYKKMVESLKRYQGKDGMWNQLVDHPDCWPETSGSAMFTYAIITGVKHGWLDRNVYAPIARRAWLALVPYINEEGDVREVCVGTNKKNDKQYYYERPRIAGDFHGQAPYLWCATALIE